MLHAYEFFKQLAKRCEKRLAYTQFNRPFYTNFYYAQKRMFDLKYQYLN